MITKIYRTKFDCRVVFEVIKQLHTHAAFWRPKVVDIQISVKSFWTVVVKLLNKSYPFILMRHTHGNQTCNSSLFEKKIVKPILEAFVFDWGLCKNKEYLIIHFSDSQWKIHLSRGCFKSCLPNSTSASSHWQYEVIKKRQRNFAVMASFSWS